MLDHFPVLKTRNFDEFFACARHFHPEMERLVPSEGTSFAGTVSAFRFGDTAGSSVLESVSSTIGHFAADREVNDVRVLISTTKSMRAACGQRIRELPAGGFAGLTPASPMVSWGTAGHMMVLRVNGRRVAATMREFDVGHEIAPILDAVFFDPALPGLHDLAMHIQHLVASIDHESDTVVNLGSFRAAHEELIVLRLAEILAGAARSEGARPVARNSGALRRAIHYIKEHAPERIALTDLAHYAGLSLRSLRLMFRRELDCTITRFIQDERLAIVRDRLEHARPGQSVTEIACDSGFNHLGDFARVYGWTFHERPSETLRRARKRTLARSG